MILPQVALLAATGGAAILALTALAVVCLLWKTSSRQCERVEQRLTARLAATEAAVESMRLAMQEVCKDLDQLETAGPTPPAQAKSCMNLSRRSQALRLHRRGETPQQIATALGVPKQEIDLLIKVHQIVVSNV